MEEQTQSETTITETPQVPSELNEKSEDQLKLNEPIDGAQETPQTEDGSKSSEKKKKKANSKPKGDQNSSANAKEQKTKRKIKTIIGLNSQKDCIVQFADAEKPEVVSNSEMKANYTKELLNFYETKIEIVQPEKTDP